MRIHGCILGKLSLLLALFPATSPAQPDPNQRFVLAGRVVNAVTGEPVGRAVVSWRLGRYLPSNRTGATLSTGRAFTDAAGVFHFPDLPPDKYILEVSKPHFVGGNSTNVELSGSKEDVEIRLNPLVSIEGSLADDSARPLAMAVIEGYRVAIIEGSRRIYRVRTVSTDDRGYFRMWDLNPGRYLIRAAGRTGGTIAVTTAQLPPTEWNQTVTPTYHDGSKQRNTANPVELHSGENLRVNFSALLQASFKVRGSIHNLSPSEETKITVYDAFGEQVACRISYNKLNGNFQINDLVPGTYRVRATQGEKEQARRGEVEVKLERTDATDVLLNLSPGVFVSGFTHCSGPDGEIIDSQNYRHNCALSAALINTETGESFRLNYGQRDSGFKIGPVFPGEYRLQSTVLGGYVVSVLANGTPLTPGATLTLAAGASAPDLEIRLKVGTAGIDITLDPAVDPGLAELLLVPSTARFEGVQTTTWCRNGCSFSNIAPGDYTVYLMRKGSQIEYNNPQALRNLEGGVPVQVTENAKMSITLKRFAQ